VTATEYAFAAPPVVTRGRESHFKTPQGAPRGPDRKVATLRWTGHRDLDTFVKTPGQPIAPTSASTARRTLNKGRKPNQPDAAGRSYAIVCTLTDLDSVPGKLVPRERSPLRLRQRDDTPLTSRRRRRLPAAGHATLVATDYAFKLSPFTRRPAHLVFRNESPAQPHFAAIGEFPPGRRETAAKPSGTLRATPERPPAGRDPQQSTWHS